MLSDQQTYDCVQIFRLLPLLLEYKYNCKTLNVVLDLSVSQVIFIFDYADDINDQKYVILNYLSAVHHPLGRRKHELDPGLTSSLL